MKRFSNLALALIFLLFQVNIAQATDFPVKYNIELEGSLRKLIAPLSDFKNSTAVEIDLKEFSKLNIELSIKGIEKDTELYDEILSKLELQLIDAQQNIILSHTNSSINASTNSIEFYWRKILTANKYYLLVNSSDATLYEQDISLEFSFNNPATSGAELGEFTKSSNLGFMTPGDELKKVYKDATPIRSSFLHFYDFELVTLQHIQIKKLSGEGEFILYNSDQELMDRGDNLDLLLDAGEYFLEFSRYPDSSDSDGNPLSPDYEISVKSIADSVVEDAELVLELTGDDGIVFKDSIPAYFSTKASGEDNIYSSFMYEMSNGTKVPYVFDLSFGNKSKACKKRKNKLALAICSSKEGRSMRSFRSGNTYSVLSSVKVKKFKKRKISGKFDFSYSQRGSEGDKQDFIGELLLGKFVLKIPKRQ